MEDEEHKEVGGWRRMYFTHPRAKDPHYTLRRAPTHFPTHSSQHACLDGAPPYSPVRQPGILLVQPNAPSAPEPGDDLHRPIPLCLRAAAAVQPALIVLAPICATCHPNIGRHCCACREPQVSEGASSIGADGAQGAAEADKDVEEGADPDVTVKMILGEMMYP